MTNRSIKQEILSRLKERLNLHKVILFGSFARGTPHEDSDLDLIVVLDNQETPTNYNENIQNYLTEEWLKAADDDLRVIEKIGSDEFLTHMVAFHSQQTRLQ
ncbi:MAG: nucleotidyltransferase domain-containing protein [Desulfobacteraceae bacterium]|nr:MAG: nucleotidyltransferase domain-containing protein [Desulfobacteraceae bacterium]